MIPGHCGASLEFGLGRLDRFSAEAELPGDLRPEGGLLPADRGPDQGEIGHDQ